MSHYPHPICKGKVGIPLSRHYEIGMRAYTFDLEAMIIAFGPELVRRQLEIAAAKLAKQHNKKPRVRVKANSAA